MLIAVNYHYIREDFDSPYPSIFGVTPEQFARHLDVLGQTAPFLSAGDITDIIQGRKKLPSRAVVVTFDDGFKEQYELARPILQKKGIPAIFFVNTRPIEEGVVINTHKVHIIRAQTSPKVLLEILENICRDQDISLSLPDAKKAGQVYRYDTPENARIKYFLNYGLGRETQDLFLDHCFRALGFDQACLSRSLYMDRAMISGLAKAGMLGTHGHAHLPLGLLDEDLARADLDISINRLCQWTGCNVEALSYPFGFKDACSMEVAHFAGQKGVKFAFTMERAGNRDLDNPMFLARFSEADLFRVNQGQDLEEFWDRQQHASWFRRQEGIN